MNRVIKLKETLITTILSVAVVLVITSCVETPDPRGNLPEEGGCAIVQGDTSLSPKQYAAFVATTDFTLSGGFAAIDLNRFCTWNPDPVDAADIVSPDPVAKAFADNIYILNRFTYDNISVLDKRFSMVRQYSVADSSCDPSNPHDLEFKSADRAYLSRYECRDIWIINPKTGAKLGTIDLTAAGYGGSDGIPEMSGMLMMGDTLFVAIQNMNRLNWQPEGPGKLVVIDTATDTITGHVDLIGKNPVTDVIYSDSLGAILVGSVGSYAAVGDGGIEAVHPASLTSMGYAIDETALGGNPADFVIQNSGQAYAAITTKSLATLIVRFDPTAGTRTADPVYTVDSSYTIWDIALSDSGLLFISDRTATKPGIAVIDALDNDLRLTGAPIDTGFPPFSIVFLR